MIIKLAASTADEFGRRLLKGAPYLSGNTIGLLERVHRNASEVIKARALHNYYNAASALGYAKSFSGYAKTAMKPNLAEIKATMGSKFKTTSKSVAP